MDGDWQNLARKNEYNLRQTSGFIVDWDGCCALENRLLPNAARFLRHVQNRVVILSNNSSDTIETFEDILREADVSIPSERILLAGVTAVQHAITSRAERVLMLGSSRMKAYARNYGLTLVREDADTVLLLRDTRFSYARLEAAVNALADGARLIVANPDMTHTGENGRIKPETGALLAAMQACVQLPESHEIIGKPAGELFHRALSLLNLAPLDVMMIGDNRDTDIAGAQRIGIPCLLVRDTPDEIMSALARQLEALD